MTQASDGQATTVRSMVANFLRRWTRLPAADRALLWRALWWLGTSRLALWLLPLRVVRRVVAPAGPPSGRATVTAARIGWAISWVRRIVPRATCLPQAVAAEALLRRSGFDAELRIGVLKSPGGGLLAHAWVESGGRIVVGDLDGELGQYTPLPPLPG